MNNSSSKRDLVSLGIYLLVWCIFLYYVSHTSPFNKINIEKQVTELEYPYPPTSVLQAIDINAFIYSDALVIKDDNLELQWIWLNYSSHLEDSAGLGWFMNIKSKVICGKDIPPEVLFELFPAGDLLLIESKDTRWKNVSGGFYKLGFSTDRSEVEIIATIDKTECNDSVVSVFARTKK